MKLNPFETFIVNNPVREIMLADTVRALDRAAGFPSLGRVLEVGCGRGDALRHIARRYRLSSLDAFDLDEKQVDRAHARIAARRLAPEVRLFVGDAEHINAPDASYDGVFEFTILHHVPDWRAALREIRRVLRPGGFFLFEELSLEFFEKIPVLSPLLRRFTEHPWGTMFDYPQFEEGLREAEFELVHLQTHIVPN